MNITPELAEKILEVLKTGAENTSTTVAELLTETIHYFIFIESLNVLKSLLGGVLILVLIKVVKMIKQTTDDKEWHLRLDLWRLLIVTGIGVTTLYSSYNGVTELGKIIVAPKIYLAEKAYSVIKKKDNPKEPK